MLSSPSLTVIDETQPSGVGTSGHRRLDIQGLRAVAVLMVVAQHAGLPVSGGFVGVDVFFVISGFVITGMLQREWTTVERVRFGEFYIRRFQRLTPALALMVSVTILISIPVLSPLGGQQTAAKTAAGAMLLVANFVLARNTGNYFDAPAHTIPLLHTWSLSVEEQFYLIFPAAIAGEWMIGRRAGGRLKNAPTATAIVLGIAVASFGAAWINAAGHVWRHARFLLGFYGPVGRAWEFAAGALVALSVKTAVNGVNTAVNGARKLGLAIGLFGVLMLIASLWLITDTTPFPGPWTLLPVIGSCALLLAGSLGINPVTAALATTPLVAIGDWSYSIYLWHWPLIVFASLLWPNATAAAFVAGALSFVPALVSYKWVELPIRGISPISRSRIGRIAFTTFVPPLALAGALGFAATQGFWSPVVVAYQAATIPRHMSDIAECNTAVPLGQRSGGDCTWNAAEPGPPIYMVGDSNAEHFSEAVIGAGATLHRPSVIATANGCPFVDMPMQPAFVPRDECNTFVQGTLDSLKSRLRGLVVISMSDTYWFGSRVITDLNVDRTFEHHQADALGNDLRLIVSSLQQAGQRVMLVQSTPKWHEDYRYTPLTCSILTVLARRCAQQMPRAWAERAQYVLREALSSAARETGAALLDSWAQLCPETMCSTETDGLIRYRDYTHISVPQSKALTPVFASAIASASR